MNRSSENNVCYRALIADQCDTVFESRVITKKGFYMSLNVVFHYICIEYIIIPPQTVFVGGYTVFTLSDRPDRAHEKTLVEYTWNSGHRLPHTDPPCKFLRFIVNKNHNGMKLICIFKGNYKC